MPRVEVKLYTILREAAGFKETVVEGRTVGEILNRLADRVGGKFRSMLFEDDGRLNKFYIVLLNGRNIVLSKGLDTPVSNGDVIAIFPPVGGG